MPHINRYIETFILLNILFIPILYAQNHSVSYKKQLTHFVSLSIGAQMSGIKSEDFVSSNYSPLFILSAGKWLNSYFGLQVGYRGYYFEYIEDNERHKYNYFFAEGIINLNKVFLPDRLKSNWHVFFHSGIGYFYNYFYDKSNVCATIGGKLSYSVTENYSFTAKLTSIIGWDLYQGNLDILPGITFGFIYKF